MKIVLPESSKDITLAQFQRYEKLLKKVDDFDLYTFQKKKIEIFTNIPFRDIDKIKQTDFEFIVNQIDTALNQEAEFENRFTLNGVELGFIPNFDKITTAEFVDLSNNGVEVENLHKVMAILFRPIVSKDAFGNYQIANYNGTEELAEAMKQTPLNIVNGALLFFCNLASELQNYILKSMEEVQAKAETQRTTLKSGDGMLQS
jgi:hypothetical protein